MSRFVLERGFHERDRAAVEALLREYEAALGVSLCFQDFEAEIAGLPGDYAPPRGVMLLARGGAGGDLIGCVALRAMPGMPERCEMKRMYVREAARGSGLGRALAVAIIEEAKGLGYRNMGLDTLPHLAAAQELYRSLGFRQTGLGDSEPRVLLFERELAA
jgi:ribosomal protein S18 acetylase RimI-like enzyme